MGEHLIWGHQIDQIVPNLRTPTLMIHSDRAASGGVVPRQLFAAITAARKELAWLGGQGQLQSYEDPMTIDQTIPHIARFFTLGQVSVRGTQKTMVEANSGCPRLGSSILTRRRDRWSTAGFCSASRRWPSAAAGPPSP